MDRRRAHCRDCARRFLAKPNLVVYGALLTQERSGTATCGTGRPFNRFLRYLDAKGDPCLDDDAADRSRAGGRETIRWYPRIPGPALGNRAPGRRRVAERVPRSLEFRRGTLFEARSTLEARGGIPPGDAAGPPRGGL